ncbi:MAG: hypothetical protein HY298_13115 [Verrucomicrobia bacterium]|nr:hypothetical protein [Verrucomicrobiota bacterium]
MMKMTMGGIGILILVAAISGAYAQDQNANKEVITIPKEQYQKMLDEHQKLLEEMKEMKAFKAKVEESLKKDSAQQTETDQALDDIDKRLKDVKQMAKDSFPGSTKLLLAGYGTAGFTAQNNGGNNFFSATFNPIFLWKLSDRLLFEGEFEAELEGHDTSLALEMAQISYLLNDYMTIGAGKFLNPMDYFVERQHMGWVNKFPDKPLAVYDGLLPEAEVGLQIRGGIPVGPTKFGYAIYAANAPELNVDPTSISATDLGTLEYDNFDNVGKHVAVGGRIGFFPIPELEIGYGLQFSDVSPPGSGGTVNAFLQSVDLSYVRESVALKGIVNLKAQWVWSHIDRFTYDPAGTIGGPFRFNNNRDGGYVQLAFRPSRFENNILKNLEPVLRYDMLNQAKTPTGVDEQRLSMGLDYWLGPSTVVKVAYELDHQNGSNAERHDAILLQFATGF